MKIALLTYHRSYNYGAMLQAVALRQTVANLGHETFFIDYWPQHQKNIYRLFVWEEFWQGGIKGRFRYLKHFAKRILPKLLRRKNFYCFYHIEIRPFVRSQKEEYDIIIYGSDQIWRKQGWGYGYNPVYFGKNDFKAKKHISYAASMGTLPNSEEDIEIIKEYVINLDAISVREKELQTFLKERCFIEAEQTIDPTFLLTKEDWKKFVGEKRIVEEPYLLFYDLQGGAFGYDEVKRFANKHHLDVIRLNGIADNMPTVSDRTTDGPYEFLNLLYYADYVITSSFHGLAFSLIFHKPFFCSVVYNGARMESLLSSVGLSDRLISNKNTIEDAYPKEIDWELIETSLGRQTMKSELFLRKALCY